jgi:lysophospholipase L1-like esterase
MNLRHWLPELQALLLLPWLLAQGRRARQDTPRLPEAAGQRHGVVVLPDAGSGVRPLTILAIGESPVAGVGVDLQEQAITAQLAQLLACQWQRPVRWQALGKNGATVRDALASIRAGTMSLPSSQVQVLLVAFGVNDTTSFHRSDHYRRDLQALLAQLEQRLQPQLTILTGVPPVHLFPALPQPLRHVLGQKAHALSAVARQLAQQRPHTIFVPVTDGGGDPGLLARDGYHPSIAGVRLWAQQLAQAVVTCLPIRGL